MQVKARRETQIRELELRVARLESAAARQQALTPQVEAEMGQRLGRIHSHVAAANRVLDAETRKLADLQRLAAVKQQVQGSAGAALCAHMLNCCLRMQRCGSD